MAFDSQSLIIGLLMSGFISTILLILVFAVFGRLIIIQFQRWRLAKKGFVEVEHVSETNIRRYFIMKPKSGKFDVNDGFYFYIPEALTKGGDLLKKYSKSFLTDDVESSEVFKALPDDKKEAFLNRVREERKLVEGLVDVVKNLNFKNEALSWKFGMPMITYYGDNPEPFVFRDKSKTFGSGVIKDAYLRLLMTQRFKDFQLFLIVGLVSLVIIALAVSGLFFMNKNLAGSLDVCTQTLNASVGALKSCLEANLPVFNQNSTVFVGCLLF